ncbi:MAG: hypothetical protein M3133_05545 [Actinomycetota bacterium]|nr:hypothetical protein [Actinomycetota bacterium]
MASGTARVTAHRGSMQPDAETSRPALGEVLWAARELLTYDDPLDAELWASALVEMWREQHLVDDEPESLYGHTLVRFAGQHAGPEALACLAALASVAGPTVARKAGQTVDELRRRGVWAPSWVARLRPVRVVGAWTARDPFGDQEVVLLAFAHDGQKAHTFQLLVDHNLGGMVKDGFLTDTSLEEVLAEWHPSGAWAFRAVDAAEAATKVRLGLEVRDHCLDAPDSRSLADCRIVLDARLRLLQQGPVARGEALDEAARSGLVEAFFSSPESTGVPDDGRLARMFVDYRCDLCGEDPLRWSPTVVLLFLLDWLPRRASLPSEAVHRVPAVLRAWVRFAGKRRKLASHLIEEILTTVGEVEDDYLEAMGQPVGRGRATLDPARAAVGAMLQDGVDVADEAEVDAWLADFKRSLEAERRQLLHA